MDQRMRRIRDEIKLVQQMVNIGLITTDYYQANAGTPSVLMAHVRQVLNTQYIAAKQFNDASNLFNRARQLADTTLPRLKDELVILQTTLSTVDEQEGERRLELRTKINKINRRISEMNAIIPVEGTKQEIATRVGEYEAAAKDADRALNEAVDVENQEEGKNIALVTRGDLLRKYYKARNLFNQFRSTLRARELFNIPPPQIVERPPREGQPQQQIALEQTVEQQDQLMEMQMPLEIKNGNAQGRAVWMAQQRQLIAQGGQLEAQGVQLRDVHTKLNELLGHAEVHQGQGVALLHGQEQAQAHRADIAQRQAEQFEEVKDKLDQISMNIGRYQNNMRQQMFDCFPLTCANLIPCIFKFLGIIVQFIIYMHKVTYDATRVAGRLANISLQGIPYFGTGLGNFAEAVVLIGMLMLYLAVWTALFGAAGLSWDAQEIFIYVCSTISEIIKGIISFFWNTIKAIPAQMGTFVYRSVKPLVDGAGNFLRGLWLMFCDQLPPGLRWLLGCPGSGLFSGGSGVAGQQGDYNEELSFEQLDEFFSVLARSIPKDLQPDIDKITTYLSNENLNILSIQELACNIIHKMEQDATQGRSACPAPKSSECESARRLFLQVTTALEKKGYGPSKKLPTEDISRGLMKCGEKIPSYVQKKLPKIFDIAEDISTEAQQKEAAEEENFRLLFPDVVGKYGDLMSTDSKIGEIRFHRIPPPSASLFKLETSSLLDNLVGLVNMWNTNFLFDPRVSDKEQIELINKRGGIPFGISDKSAAVLQKKILRKRCEIADSPKKDIIPTKIALSQTKRPGNISQTIKLPLTPQTGIQAAAAAAAAGGRKKRTKKRRRKKRRYSRRRKKYKTMRRKRTKRRKYKKRKSRRKRSKQRRSH